MNLPDFMSYSNKFTSSDFIEKISRIAKRAGAKMIYAALVLYYTLQSDKISVKAFYQRFGFFLLSFADRVCVNVFKHKAV